MRRALCIVVGVALLAGLGAGAGCTGMVEPLYLQADSEPAHGSEADDAGSPDGHLQAPGQLGAPCQAGCDVDLACVAGVCRRLCAQAGCNAPAEECAENEACIGSDSVPEVCLPAEANEGDACGDDTLCVGGTVCLQIDDQIPRCVGSCSQGCDTNSTCSRTIGDCQVCTP